MLQLLVEDTEKYILIGECEIDVLPSIVRPEQFKKCDGMLAAHVLCVMYGRRSRSSGWLRHSLPSVSEVYVCLPYFCTECTARTTVVSVSRGICAGVSNTRCTCKTCILSMHFAEVYRRPLYTDESCLTRTGIANRHNEHICSDEHPHAIQFPHHQRQFSFNLWAGILGDCLIGRHNLPARDSGRGYLNFLSYT
jgi:hypothetical protein